MVLPNFSILYTQVSDQAVLAELVQVLDSGLWVKHIWFLAPLVYFRPDRGQKYKKLTTKKIYLIRHGETEFNRKKVVQGSGIDAPLNDIGQAQAAAFYEGYKDIGFDKVYTSALKRSIESVALFITHGLPWESFSELNEINWGSKEGMPFNEQDHQSYQEVTESWRRGEINRAIAGGESPKDVFIRQKVALERIMARTGEKMILICMHGRAIRIFLCLLLNYDLSHMDIFPHRNMGLYVLSYTGTMFSVDTYNDGSHLDQLTASKPLL